MTRLLYALLLLATTATAAPRPNVVIYLADDMGMGDTSAYQDWSGNPDNAQLHTPELERLARRGIRFTDAHSPHSRCTTTRYALLTGRYCWRTPLKHWVLFGVQGDPLIEPNRPTIATFLNGHGYRTGMVGKWHVGLTYTRTDGTPADAWHDADLRQPIADGPLDHGFDFFHGFSRSHPTSGPDGQKRNTPDQSIGPGWIHNRTITGATDNGKQLDGSYVLRKIAPTLHQQASTFLADSTKPFLLYFASPANHTPHTPADQIAGRPVRGTSKFKNGTPTESARLDFIYENDVQVGLLLDHLENTDDPRNPGHKLIHN
ncbi:MAG: sulfatase-like hydrolase/transferase, partial [Verrucomicrobiales bacterium]|nr:sulfatase-like hydrolase/transferase [Verrucomicrobiales bacterium]